MDARPGALRVQLNSVRVRIGPFYLHTGKQPVTAKGHQLRIPVRIKFIARQEQQPFRIAATVTTLRQDADASSCAANDSQPWSGSCSTCDIHTAASPVCFNPHRIPACAAAVDVYSVARRAGVDLHAWTRPITSQTERR